MTTSIRYRIRNLSMLTLMSAIAVAASGCSDAETLEPSLELIDKSSQALAVGEMLSVNGTYGLACTDRSGAWSIAAEVAAVLDNPVLSVIKNDTACELTLTSIIADQEYQAAPEILLESAYQVAASEFSPTGLGPVSFYANSKINPADFSADFAVTVLYSDDANAASGVNNATYAEWESAVVGDQVTAPNYGATDSIAVQTDVNGVVTLSEGSFDLIDGTNLGEHYFVDLGTLAASPTFAQVDGVFSAGSPTAIIGANPSIAVSVFDLDGETLPVVRTLIIRHVESDVIAYQTFKITFNAP